MKYIKIYIPQQDILILLGPFRSFNATQEHTPKISLDFRQYAMHSDVNEIESWTSL